MPQQQKQPWQLAAKNCWQGYDEVLGCNGRLWKELGHGHLDELDAFYREFHGNNTSPGNLRVVAKKDRTIGVDLAFFVPTEVRGHDIAVATAEDAIGLSEKGATVVPKKAAMSSTHVS